MSQAGPSIVWFGTDLRVADQPALAAAAERGGPVIPVYIWAPDEEGGWPPGAARKWWLHRALVDLETSLHERGLRLIVRRGESLAELQSLINETRAEAVYWNRRYEPAIVQRDTHIKQALKDAGIEAHSFQATLMYEPGSVMTGSGEPYTVFTPFWKALQKREEPPRPVEAPGMMTPPSEWPETLGIHELGLNPEIEWDTGLRAFWTVGEQAAHDRLAVFMKDGLNCYDTLRDRPDLDGTSRMSPYLANGQITARQIWHAVRTRLKQLSTESERESAWGYLRELGWREFSYHVMFHFPRFPDEAWKSRFAEFPWAYDDTRLRAWQRGQTGYPIVDAGMRQLWAVGWMHNRIRMVVASFLCKDLLLPWQWGASWFWDTLVDADLANNAQGWQWSAGSGTDAAPYFRIFNPVRQAERFDPDHAYVREHVPEIAELPDKHVQTPWAAPEAERARCGLSLGETYPEPLVDHKAARQRALAAFEQVKG